jgi:hypothetical protein
MATSPTPGSRKTAGGKQQSPQATPECANATPGLDLFAGGVKPDRMFFAVIALADDGQLLDVETGAVQDADGLFGFCVGWVNGVMLFHVDSSSG